MRLSLKFHSFSFMAAFALFTIASFVAFFSYSQIKAQSVSKELVVRGFIPGEHYYCLVVNEFRVGAVSTSFVIDDEMAVGKYKGALRVANGNSVFETEVDGNVIFNNLKQFGGGFLNLKLSPTLRLFIGAQGLKEVQVIFRIFRAGENPVEFGLSVNGPIMLKEISQNSYGIVINMPNRMGGAMNLHDLIRDLGLSMRIEDANDDCGTDTLNIDFNDLLSRLRNSWKFRGM